MTEPLRPNRLRSLLQERADALSERVLESGSMPPPAELDELERLNRLATIADAAHPLGARKRWPIVVALGGTLLLVSVLLFARVPATDIELDLITSEASFLLPTQQVVAEAMDLTAIGVAGLTHYRLPSEVVEMSNADAIRVAANTKGSQVGSVNLGDLIMPAGTRIRVRPTTLRGQYRLSLSGSSVELHLAVVGPIEIGTSASPRIAVDFTAPRSIALRADSSVLDVDVSVPDGVPAAFSPLLDARELSLFHVDDYAENRGSVVRRVSAIQSGTLYLESLNGREYRLRSGQLLEFDKFEGQIRSLQLADNQIKMQVHGRVRGMRTGVDSSKRSLMPTMLEWLSARHGLSLLWGTTLYLFGTLAGVLRWWNGKAD